MTKRRGIPQQGVCAQGVEVLRSLLVIQIAFMGCNGSGKGSDTGLPNALNDQDAGSPTPDADGVDADEGADVDTDGGPPAYEDWGLVGKVEYWSTNNSITACDTSIKLDGTAFVGECEGCDYAFMIEPTIEEDRGDPDACELNPLLSFVSDGVREDLILAHADEAYIDQDDVEVLITNSVQVGFSMYYEATETSEAVRIEGPFWWQMYHNEIEKDSTFSRDGNALNWTFAFENTVATWDDFAMLDDCGQELTDEATEGFVSDTVQSNDVPCDGWQADVWEVVLSEGDGGFQVQVDTTNPETTFDPAILVNDPDGCVSLYADDGFDCTHPPPHYMCPAGTVTGDPGIYQIMVFSYGQCTGGDVEYSIQISDANVGDSLVLAMDNIDRFENLEFTNKRIEVSGCATLFPEGTPSDVDVCEPAESTEDDTGTTDTGTTDTDTGTPDTGTTDTDTGTTDTGTGDDADAEDSGAPDTTGSDVIIDGGSDEPTDGGVDETTASDGSGGDGDSTESGETGDGTSDGGSSESESDPHSEEGEVGASGGEVDEDPDA